VGWLFSEHAAGDKTGRTEAGMELYHALKRSDGASADTAPKFYPIE